jgi:hypothetical protein
MERILLPVAMLLCISAACAQDTLQDATVRTVS